MMFTKSLTQPRSRAWRFKAGRNWRLLSSIDNQWAQPTTEDARVHPAEDVFEAGLRHHHTANTAYPIAHSKTFRPYRVKRTPDQSDIKNRLLAAYAQVSEMMLYVHVPFCEQRCQFCEYTVVNPAHGKQASVQEQCFDSLMGEFDLYRDLLATEKKRLVGFDIGGGTPSVASIHNIERVMNKMDECFDFDPSQMSISIETTPRIAAAEPEKIKAYFEMGIRRISMGVQTTDFSLAKRLGRNDGDYLKEAVRNIRAAGFESFNVDLMYGFPLREGSRDKWAETISNTIHVLEPDHITLYRMRYKGTKMAHLQERVGLQQVNTKAAKAGEILADAGYEGWIGKNTFSRLKGDSGCSDYL
jgi:oxygen-independent coproporphyrinogen III oxidase